MAEIRSQLDIPMEAYVIKLAMGQNGLAEDMKKILRRIKEEEKKLTAPLYVYVICGRNKALKDDLESYAKSKGKVHIRVMGFLQEEEMARVDRA